LTNILRVRNVQNEQHGGEQMPNNNLKAIRNNRKMTQKEMADLLGYTVEHYNKVENGTLKKRLPIHKASLLAEKLGITLDEIFLKNN
jgi:DNA-binding XRE family transcriptional regulator